MEKNTFPAYEGHIEPLDLISTELKIPIDELYVGFGGLGIPEWVTPAHLDSIRRQVANINEAIRHVENLQTCFSKISEQDSLFLRQGGAPTFEQIQKLKEELSRIGDYSSFLEAHKRQGGKNPAAYIVAEGMRRTFRRSRRNITYGQSPDGAPTTDFCRSVKVALDCYSIIAGWRGPARAAFDKQNKIIGRLSEIHLRKIREQYP